MMETNWIKWCISVAECQYHKSETPSIARDELAAMQARIEELETALERKADANRILLLVSIRSKDEILRSIDELELELERSDLLIEESELERIGANRLLQSIADELGCEPNSDILAALEKYKTAVRLTYLLPCGHEAR